MKIRERADAMGFLLGLWVTLITLNSTVHAQSAPLPACQSGCVDSDEDGLCDSWEKAHGVDLNGDGRLDSVHDLKLPGSDPKRPDIYVQYDYMGYGGLDYACQTDFDCLQNGATCAGPPVPGGTKSCVQVCQVNADCAALGGAHSTDLCTGPQGAMSCKHTHDPELLAPGALAAVQAQFTAHGINLHILRGRALPHSHVLSYRLLSDPVYPSNVMTDTCEGGSLASGTAGIGQYAESFYDLKARFFDSKKSLAYHYIIFSHDSGCDTDEHCTSSHLGVCQPALNTDGTAKTSIPPFGQSGHAEVFGNDFIVSLGVTINDNEADLTGGPGYGDLTFGQLIIGGTFMHELGHNLGLHHGGGSGPEPCSPPGCEDAPGFKPNYLSVMNYRYQMVGISQAVGIGSSLPAAVRLDYSNQTLPIGGPTPGELVEAGQLNELAGLGSGNADLFNYTDATCVGHLGAATDGPVDWDGDGVAGDNLFVSADLDPMEVSPPRACTVKNQWLRGHTDWGPAPGQSVFLYRFQCTPMFPDGPGTASAGSASIASEAMSSNFGGPELSAKEAIAAHVLYAIRPVHILIRPGCTVERKPIVPGEQGEISVALLGEAGVDVLRVDLSSLQFHGASLVRTSFTDVNGDGQQDLLAVFDMRKIQLNSHAKSARLTGWFKNSQAFLGEDQIAVVSSLESFDPNCH